MATPDPRNGLIPPQVGDYTPANLQSLTGIPSVTVPNPVGSFDPATAQKAIQENLNGLRNYAPSQAVNPYQLGKEKVFGAGLNHHQFERYYEHPKFETLGFSPFRDNEAFYNKNSSAFHDFQRTLGEWGTLTGLGLKDAFGFGDLTDTENAKKYERAMAIGSSTRGGMAGFANNLFLNSGYTFGILAEMALEEVGLALATAGTLGAASPITVPAMGLRATRAFSKIKNAYDATRNIIKTLDNLQDVNKARQYFNAAAKGTVNFLNPLEQTTSFIRDFNKMDNLTNLAKVSVGAGAFYRDVRNMRLVYGESALEGGFVKNQMEEQLLNEHYLKYDRAPTDQEAEAIRQTSLKAGESTAYWNMPVIFMSNKLVFDNLFKTFNPVRRLTTDVVTENVAGKIIQSAAKKSPFEVVESGIKSRFKSAINIRNYPGRLLSYGKANLAEGLQESFQEVIAGATTQYYMDQYNSGTRGGVYSYIGQNIQKQFTAEGAEIFLSGFLMGGIAQGPQKIISKGFKVAQAGGFKNFREAKVAQKEHLVRTVTTLNEMYDDPAKYFAPDLENLVDQEKYQKGMSEASKKDDPMAYHDLKDASVYQHVSTALRLGKMDSFIQRLEEMKNLSPEEFKEAFPGFAAEETSTAINKVIARAKSIETRYNTFQQRYPNPFNPAQHKYGTEEYKETMLNKMAHDSAVQQAVFMQDSFDRVLTRINSIQGELKGDTGLKNVVSSDLAALYSITDSQNEIKQLKAELKPFEGAVLDSQARKFKADKEAKLNALEDFTESLDRYMEIKGSASKDSLSREEKKSLQREQSSAADTLFKKYSKYLRHLAKVSDDHVFSENVEKSFQKLLDLYNLHDNTARLTVAVNALTDPKGFTRLRARIQETMQHAHANRKALIADALSNYQAVQNKNALLGKLHDANMFFDPNQIDTLLEDGKLPDNFFYAEGPNALDEVPKTSDDYQKALHIISEFVEVIMEKPIEEQVPSPYDLQQGQKRRNDKRTYADYAKQFGFDPKAAESVVPLRKVLQAVIESKFTSIREKALAKRLLFIAKDNETVTFSKTMSTAGSYNPVTQTKIDPRYSASDFATAGIPIEANILRQELHRRANNALTADETFKKDIQKLYDAAKATADAQIQKTGMPVPFLGLRSLEDFVSEAMINTRFQAYLNTIPFAASQKASSWTEFVDSIQRMLKRLFGVNNTNTVLNGAVDIITTRFDVRTSPDVTAGTEPLAPSSEVAITGETVLTVLNLDTPAGVNLRNSLIQAYKNQNRSLQEREETPLDYAWAEMSDEALLNSPAFLKYASTISFKAVKEAIAEFNKATGREQKAPEPVQSSVKIPLIITSAMKVKLDKLGYTAADIGQLTPKQANDIIDGNIKKTGRRDSEIEKETRTRNEVKRQGLINMISNATMDTLSDAEEVIFSLMSNSAELKEIGFSIEQLENMLEAKKQDLAYTVDFDTIRVGEELIITLPDKTGAPRDIHMIVDRKTLTDIKLHKVGDVTFTHVVNKNQVQQKIKFKYNTMMEKIDIEDTSITDDEKEIVVQDFKQAQSLTDEESLKEDDQKARKLSAEEAEKNLLDGIEDC